MTPAVGADIASLCVKCGDVWHVVLAKIGEQIIKVQCKECGAQHRYKRPGGGDAKKTRAPRKTRTPRDDRPIARIDTPAVAPDLARPMRTYAPSDTYAVGDRVEHPSFGQGVVESAIEPGKITAFFPSGRRVLVHDRQSTRPQLGKPVPFDHRRPGAQVAAAAPAALSVEPSEPVE